MELSESIKGKILFRFKSRFCIYISVHVLPVIRTSERLIAKNANRANPIGVSGDALVLYTYTYRHFRIDCTKL